MKRWTGFDVGGKGPSRHTRVLRMNLRDWPIEIHFRARDLGHASSITGVSSLSTITASPGIAALTGSNIQASSPSLDTMLTTRAYPTATAFATHSGLSNGAKIAIGVAIPVAFITLLIALFLFLRRRKETSRPVVLEGGKHPEQYGRMPGTLSDRVELEEKPGHPQELEEDTKPRLLELQETETARPTELDGVSSHQSQELPAHSASVRKPAGLGVAPSQFEATPPDNDYRP